MKNICIYCGSSMGTAPEYAAAARRLGRALADRGLGLVYGGGRVGLMGVVADEVLVAGGQVIGVIPEALATEEVAHNGLTELHVVADMHERKALMARRADAFLTMPGGIGTFEEFFETLSWAALKLHQKPLGILNVAGYFDPLLALLDHAVSEGFLRSKHLGLLIASEDPETLVGAMMERFPPRAAGNASTSSKTDSGTYRPALRPTSLRDDLGWRTWLHNLRELRQRDSRLVRIELEPAAIPPIIRRYSK